jgi:hypothetical protein
VRLYTDTKQYPRGVADVAGYWAEDLIFGGVVLFGRGESGTGVSYIPTAESLHGFHFDLTHKNLLIFQYDGVWFHSHRENVTYRIYALTEEQIDLLLHFLEWEPKSQSHQQGPRPECPLPILGNDNNLTRVDPDVAIPMHNVFRDRWERKASWKSPAAYSFKRGTPKNELDYPEVKRRVPYQEEDGSNGRKTLGDYLKMRRQKDRGSGPESET